MSVARNYAQALFEASLEAAPQADQLKKKLDRIEEDFSNLVQLIEGSRDLRLTLETSLTSVEEKESVLQAFRQKGFISDETVPFLKLLFKKHRQAQLSKIRDQFILVRMEREGGLLGEVVSAETLSLEDVEALQTTFSKKLGRKVVFKTNTDVTLLGGVKVQVSGVTYDGTLKTQLEKVRERCLSSLNAAG